MQKTYKYKVVLDPSMSTLHINVIVWVLGSNLIFGEYFLGYISWDVWLSVHCVQQFRKIK